MVGGAGDLSGVPSHIQNLASALQNDAQITVLSDINQGGYNWTVQTNVRHKIIRGLGQTSVIQLWHALRRLLETLQTSAADLIWLHAPLPSLLVRLTMALGIWRHRCPVVFTYHAQAFAKGHPAPRRVISRSLERFILRRSPPHQIVFLSTGMAAKARQSLGADLLGRHTCHILPNCADLGAQPRTTKNNARSMIMTARACRQKRHETAFRLFAKLPADTRLTLCGPGTGSLRFQRKAQANLSAETFARVTFVGPVPDVRPYLANADAYLLTSRYEGHPIGVLEAFETGLPIILTNFDGAADLVKLHPCAHLLSHNVTQEDPRHVITLIDHFRANEASLRPKIQSAWRAHWSPEVFANPHRAFVQNLLRPAA